MAPPPLPSVYIVSAVRTPIGQFQGYVQGLVDNMLNLNGQTDPSRVKVQFSWVPMPSNVKLGSLKYWKIFTNLNKAALQRVPDVKADEVDEVLFGNVLSAKYGHLLLQSYHAPKLTTTTAWGKTQLANALSAQVCQIPQFVPL